MLSPKLRNQLKTLISKHTTSHDLDRPYEVIVKDGKMKVSLRHIYKQMCSNNYWETD